MPLPESDTVETARVYIWRKAETMRFKVGKTIQDVPDRTKDSLRNIDPDYREFDCIELNARFLSDCETYLKNHLESKRVRWTTEIFDLSSVEEMKALIAACRTYFEEWVPLQLAVADVAGQQSDRMLPASPDELKTFAELAAVAELQNRCAWQIDLLKNKLQLIIGTAAGIAGLVSWKTEKQSDDRFDLSRFKDAEPEAYKELLVKYAKYIYTPTRKRSFRFVYVGERDESEET